MTIDPNFGRKTGHVKPSMTSKSYETKSFPEGMLVTFKGEDGKDQIGTVKIEYSGMTANVKGKLVPVDIITVNLYGGKSRRKSRKSRKTRRYRRV